MLQVNNLSFSYGPRLVLENINMKLEKGKVYGLLGENGVGKTTLLTLLCGLKKPRTGEILVDGHHPYDREPSLLADQFYLPDEVLPVRTSAIAFGKERGRFWPNFNLEKYTELLHELEVDPKHRMDKMSAGQLKKTWIAFAIACRTSYYYMDEPTNGLDIPSKAQLRKIVAREMTDEQTFIISTHQVRDLENLIDPILVMNERELIVNASLEEISEKLHFSYSDRIDPNALYVEPIPGGVIQVTQNRTGEESKVNIEAFFNTVHLHKDLIKNLFNQ